MIRRPTWLMIAAALVAAPLRAADPVATEPVRLRAERIELDQRTGVSRYQGRVVLTQGALRVTADRAEARGSRQSIEHVTAEGRPTTFRYRAAGRPEVIEGEARRAEYDVVSRQLALSGAVELREGGNLLRAGVVHYDLSTETVVAHADAEQRIYAALAPRPSPESSPETRP